MLRDCGINLSLTDLSRFLCIVLLEEHIRILLMHSVVYNAGLINGGLFRGFVILSVDDKLAENADIGEDLEGSACAESEGARIGYVVRKLVEITGEPDKDQNGRETRSILSTVV